MVWLERGHPLPRLPRNPEDRFSLAYPNPDLGQRRRTGFTNGREPVGPRSASTSGEPHNPPQSNAVGFRSDPLLLVIAGKMATTAGQGWAQLRQQARALETQVRTQLWMVQETETSETDRQPADRDITADIFAILYPNKHSCEADRRRAKCRDKGPGAARQGKPSPPYIPSQLQLTRHPSARNRHRPTRPPPRLRGNPNLLRAQTKQPLPAPRQAHRPPARPLPPALDPRLGTRPRQPPRIRPRRHIRLPCRQPGRRRG